MKKAILNIIITALLLISAGNAAMAQQIDYAHLSEMEQRSEQLTGHNKVMLLMDLAENYELISISKSMYFCQRALEELGYTSNENYMNYEDKILNEPDSILDLHARALLIMGKCYINMNEENNFDGGATQTNNVISNREHALDAFSALLKIRKRQQRISEQAQANNNIAITLMIMGNTDSATAIYNKNVEVYQRLNDKEGLAKTYNNIGLILTMQPGMSEKANSYFRKALRFAEEDSSDNIFVQASLNLADYYKSKGNNTMAFQYLDKAIPVCKRSGNIVNLNMIYIELSRIYKAQGNYKTAYEYLEKYNSLRDTVFNMEILKQNQELKTKYDIAIKDSQIDRLTEEKVQKEQKLNEDAEMMFRQKIFLLAASALLIIALWGFAHAHRETMRKNKTNALLSKANDNIKNSISYASRLQKIIITGDRTVKELLSDYFVLHKPKNIVSGDFYYVRDFGKYMVVAVADCTGHGVPAAFLSVLHITFFNEIFNNHDTAPDPGTVLDSVRSMTIKALNQTDDLSSSTDGMDCGLLIVDKDSRVARYAGAYIDLYIARHDTGTIEITKSTHNPVCWYFKQMPFKTQTVPLAPDDIIYMFSDGYTDQVEPANAEKFTKRRLRDLLERNCRLDMETQRTILQNELSAWQRNAEQIDDILLLGIRARSLY